MSARQCLGSLEDKIGSPEHFITAVNPGILLEIPRVFVPPGLSVSLPAPCPSQLSFLTVLRFSVVFRKCYVPPLRVVGATRNAVGDSVSAGTLRTSFRRFRRWYVPQPF